MKKILILLFYSSYIFAQDIAFKTEKSQLFEDDYKDSEIILAEKIEHNQFVIVRNFSANLSSKRGYYILNPAYLKKGIKCSFLK